VIKQRLAATTVLHTDITDCCTIHTGITSILTQSHRIYQQQ